ncbi:MAG: hypothetical protein ACRDAM_01335, partial [Casimicrobium sp.]
MDAAILSEMLVSYRENSSYARLSKLILEVDSVLSTLLATVDDNTFAGLNDAARAIALHDWGAPQGTNEATDMIADAAYRILLGVATAHIPRASPERGIRFAERALDIAMTRGHKEQTRRGFNVCSAIYTLTGAAADAVEYGLMAANIAKEMNYDAAVVNSLANVNAALVLMGRHDDAVEIADRVFVAFSDQDACASDLALLNTNAAKAALALKRYDDAMHYAKRAIAAIEINDLHDASNRLLNELTWMQCAIATNDVLTVNERMGEIDRIADLHRSPRNDLNRQFAAALHLGFVKKAPMAAIGQLGYLTSAAAKFVP